MHRRRTSSEANAPELTLPPEAPASLPNGLAPPPVHPYAAQAPPPPPPSQRQRVHSTPAPYAIGHNRQHSHQLEIKPSPYMGQASPRSASFVVPAHYRTTSVSAASPSSPSFRNPFNGSQQFQSALPVPPTLPEGDLLSPLSPAFPPQPPPPQNPNARRHNRIHSRNLSVFFPRPGQGPPPASIAEDGAQEFPSSVSSEAPTSLIPPAPSPKLSGSPSTRSPGTGGFAPGFKFGGRSTADGEQLGSPSTQLSPSTTTARRGHHHKHSLSHNFFSFMDPTVTNAQPPQIHTGGVVDGRLSPAMPQTPHSPWQPMSPFPNGSDLASPAVRARVDSSATPAGTLSLHDHPPPGHSIIGSVPFITAYAVLEFVAGASLWVIGQQNGSLSCTGLGYWVVFDAMGVVLGAGSEAGLFRGAGSNVRRPYGHERVETTGLFAQTIYLLFAAVYICKETVEHFLLSFGDSHHHHHSDELEPDASIFPVTLLLACLSFIVGATSLYSNHARLVTATGRTVPIPSVQNIKRLLASVPAYLKAGPASIASQRKAVEYPHSIANPFFLAPLAFGCAIIGSTFILPIERHRAADLLFAGMETLLTFNVAYPTAVTLGKVLLQTAPDRGTVDGRFESFHRVVRELERHALVVHVPPPHIWQLTPPSVVDPAADKAAQFIVSLELHVRKDLSDADALSLTRWAWERCYSALNPRGSAAGAWGDQSGGGITVGIVRG